MKHIRNYLKDISSYLNDYRVAKMATLARELQENGSLTEDQVARIIAILVESTNWNDNDIMV